MQRLAVVYLHGDLSEVLLISCLRDFGDNLPLMDVLLQRQQNLRGIDGLDEVVGNLGADGLVHDVLLLALGAHHNGRGGLYLLDILERFESAETGHHLIEEDEVEGFLTAFFNGVVAVADGYHFVAFLLEEKDVGLEQFNLVVYP